MATMPKNSISTASVNWRDGNGTTHLRVYSTDGNVVTERCWDGNGWSNGDFTAKGEAVSATLWYTGGGSNIRVYCTYQDKTVEYCVDNGGSNWYVGAYSG